MKNIIVVYVAIILLFAASVSNAENVAGMDVSLSYLSVPVKLSYLEITEQITGYDWGGGYTDVNTVSLTGAAKSQSFRQDGMGLRFAKMNRLSDSVSAGIEWGFTLPGGGKTFSFSAARTVIGSTQTVRYPSGLLDTYSTLNGPVSTEVNIKSAVVPLLAKMDFKVGDSFSVAAGLGTYFILTVLEVTENSFDYSGPTQDKTTFATVGITPAAEISAGGRVKLSDKIHFTVSGVAGYSLKEKFFGYSEHSDPGLSYKEGIESGGLSYGGKAGFSFLF